MDKKVIREWKKVFEADLGYIAYELKDMVDAPAVVVLNGPMGAGKTTFTKRFVSENDPRANTMSPSYSVLSETPNILHEIMSAIKNTLPNHIPLSAKIRLGYEDEALLFDNVAAIESAGTGTLTIHGRTKKDGYKPPARWEKIGEIQDKTTMVVVANGDITDFDSLTRCQSVSGCKHFMIGRGALNNPFVFQDIRAKLDNQENSLKQASLVELFTDYNIELQKHYDEVATLGRLKQWCGHLRFGFEEIKENLQTLRRCNSTQELTTVFEKILRE